MCNLASARRPERHSTRTRNKIPDQMRKNGSHDKNSHQPKNDNIFPATYNAKHHFLGAGWKIASRVIDSCASAVHRRRYVNRARTFKAPFNRRRGAVVIDDTVSTGRGRTLAGIAPRRAFVSASSSTASVRRAFTSIAIWFPVAMPNGPLTACLGNYPPADLIVRASTARQHRSASTCRRSARPSGLRCEIRRATLGERCTWCTRRVTPHFASGNTARPRRHSRKAGSILVPLLFVGDKGRKEFGIRAKGQHRVIYELFREKGSWEGRRSISLIGGCIVD